MVCPFDVISERCLTGPPDNYLIIQGNIFCFTISNHWLKVHFLWSCLFVGRFVFGRDTNDFCLVENITLEFMVLLLDRMYSTSYLCNHLIYVSNPILFKHFFSPTLYPLFFTSPLKHLYCPVHSVINELNNCLIHAYFIFIGVMFDKSLKIKLSHVYKMHIYIYICIYLAYIFCIYIFTVIVFV